MLENYGTKQSNLAPQGTFLQQPYIYIYTYVIKFLYLKIPNQSLSYSISVKKVSHLIPLQYSNCSMNQSMASFESFPNDDVCIGNF